MAFPVAITVAVAVAAAVIVSVAVAVTIAFAATVVVSHLLVGCCVDTSASHPLDASPLPLDTKPMPPGTTQPLVCCCPPCRHLLLLIFGGSGGRGCCPPCLFHLDPLLDPPHLSPPRPSWPWPPPSPPPSHATSLSLVLRNAKMIFAGCRLTTDKLAHVTLCAGTKKVKCARCQSATILSLHFDTLAPCKLAFLTLWGHTNRIPRPHSYHQYQAYIHTIEHRA